jgi:hypothetical protein
MLGQQTSKDYIQISRGVWEWARKKPEYKQLIEDLEDLELIAQAKKVQGEKINLNDYHVSRKAQKAL